MTFTVLMFFVSVIDGAAARAGSRADKHSLAAADQSTGCTADRRAHADSLRGFGFSCLSIALSARFARHAYDADTSCKQQRPYS